MTKVSMPEPYVEVDNSIPSCTLQYTWAAADIEFPTGTKFITTDQAEAYAAAKVREALEKVIQNLDAEADRAREHKAYAAVLALMSQAELIRVQIEKQ